MVITVPAGTHYVGTPLTLTCDITVDSAVDTSVMADVTWTRPSGVTTAETIMDGVYQSTLEFNPLSASDGGQYSCAVTISPVSGMDGFVSMSAVGMDNESLTVDGNYTVLTTATVMVYVLVLHP